VNQTDIVLVTDVTESRLTFHDITESTSNDATATKYNGCI